MMIRRAIVALLAVAVLANAALVLDALTLGAFVPTALAEGEEVDASADGSAAGSSDAVGKGVIQIRPEMLDPADGGLEVAKETYERLIAELSEQKRRLDNRLRAVVERERQLTVVRAELEAERDRIEKARLELEKKREEVLGVGAPNFARLLKAYEGMDPENAAAALAELYDRDRKVVIDVLLGVKSRQAAATLDALAATHPAKAASLSLEIWQKDPRRKRGNVN